MEYFELLNLSAEPFSNSPDPDFFFESRQHKACLQKLEIALRLHRGLNLVIGAVGTGKTTLCRQLIRELAPDDSIETHLILDPQFSEPLEFLIAIANMFTDELPAHGTNELKIKECIKQQIFKKGIDEQKTILLIIDEGQKIPEFCLEILREFLNFETNKNKLLQIAIFAQKEFKQTLQGLGNFTDRINLYMELGPLTYRETCSMIQHRLSQSCSTGETPRLFSTAAYWCIYRTTRGYPRQIITLCHQIILSMVVQNKSRVGWRFVRACAAQLFDEQTTSPHRIPIKAMLLLALLVLTVVVGLMPLQGPPPTEIKTVVPQKIPNFQVRPPAVLDRTAPARSVVSVTPEPAPEKGDRSTSPLTDLSNDIQRPPDRTAQLDRARPPKDHHPGVKPLTPERLSIKAVNLETIRGARHPEFFRIVFQFDAPFRHPTPIIEKGVALFQLTEVSTALKPLRKYKTFDAWVKLEPDNPDLNTRIGLPDDFKQLTFRRMQDPHRLVVDIYTMDPG